SIQALPSDPAGGFSGGVMAGPVLSARSEFLEQDVRNQQQYLGFAQQKATDLAQVEPLFTLNASSGLADALNGLFNSFSQLAVNPNDQVSRQSTVDAANQVAQSPNQQATGFTQIAQNISNQTRDTVSEISQLASEITHLNRLYKASSAAAADAGLDAQ